LVAILLDFDCSIWVENALHIKHSMGMTRGKNDKIDAHCIALYAFRFQDKTHLYTPPSQEISMLKTLQILRKKFVTTKEELETYAKETKAFSSEIIQKLIDQNTQTMLKDLTLKINEIEKQMYQIIQNDEELKELYRLTTSVVGVGQVTAVHLIIMTEGFTKFKTAKQLACYAGVVPFERS
jgi:transposase